MRTSYPLGVMDTPHGDTAWLCTVSANQRFAQNLATGSYVADLCIRCGGDA